MLIISLTSSHHLSRFEAVMILVFLVAATEIIFVKEEMMLVSIGIIIFSVKVSTLVTLIANFFLWIMLFSRACLVVKGVELIFLTITRTRRWVALYFFKLSRTFTDSLELFFLLFVRKNSFSRSRWIIFSFRLEILWRLTVRVWLLRLFLVSLVFSATSPSASRYIWRVLWWREIIEATSTSTSITSVIVVSNASTKVVSSSTTSESFVYMLV